MILESKYDRGQKAYCVNGTVDGVPVIIVGKVASMSFVDSTFVYRVKGTDFPESDVFANKQDLLAWWGNIEHDEINRIGERFKKGREAIEKFKE